MPVLRLFAGARDAAGTGRDVVPGATVGEVLEAARQRYGAEFTQILGTCRVWVNGEGGEDTDRVGEDDEVAVLPPVSGGAVPAATRESRRPPPRRRPRGKARRTQRAQARRPTRYAVVYDVDGPRVRLGLLWFIAIFGGLFSGEIGLSVVYGIAGAFAGLQMAIVWQEHGRYPNKAVAAVAAGIAPAVAPFGGAAVGLVILAAIPMAVVAALSESAARRQALTSAGFTLQCCVFVGVAAATPMLALRVEVGAALALLLLVSVYEMGDYLIGSGATNSIEGPAAGIAGVAVFTFALWVASIPPFHDDSILAFGAMAAVFCPVGQLFASALLPRADAPAPALRRLDSLLLLGPIWVVTLWAYLDIL